jgi:hypothetical protein
LHGESEKCRFGNPAHESSFQRLGITPTPSLFAAVKTLQGDKGARDLIAAEGDDVVIVEVNDISIALDVDTRGRLRRLQGRSIG